MLIKISKDCYIESEAIDAVQKEISYLSDTKIEDVAIYLRGGAKLYYDGTIEECIEKLKRRGKE